MKININPDKKFVNDMRKALKDNNGFCPCSLEKNEDTKCMCKERWQVEPATAVSIQKQSKTSKRK